MGSPIKPGTSPVLEILRHVVFPGPIFLSPGCPSGSALHWLLSPLLSLPRLPRLPASLPTVLPLPPETCHQQCPHKESHQFWKLPANQWRVYGRHHNYTCENNLWNSQYPAEWYSGRGDGPGRQVLSLHPEHGGSQWEGAEGPAGNRN